MPELADEYPTLLDMQRQKNPDGTFAQVAPVLTQKNPILGHIPFKPANNGTSEITTVETHLPESYLRTYNEVVPASKGGFAQVQDAQCMMQSWSIVDAEQADIESGGDVAGYRASQAKQHLAKMSNEAAGHLFYGNHATTPKEPTGLSIRFSDVTAGNARNLIDAGGAGADNTSIWFIGWGAEKVYGTFPKGSAAGITRRDWGRVAAEQHAGQTGNIEVFKERFGWNWGLTVKDWRWLARVASIDVSALRLRDATSADLFENMILAYHALESTEGVKGYANRTLMAYLDLQARDAVISGGMLGYAEVDGKRRLHFRDIPLYTCDGITNLEAAV